MNWEHLADGADILRFWKTVKPEGKEPETAILRLSSQRYDELTKDGKGFINRYKVFDKQVGSMTMVSPPAAATKMAVQSMPAAHQLVVVIHRPTCAAIGSAVADFIVAKAA